MYYVRREGRIKGPLTREKLSALREEKRLRMRDEVSESPAGPWRRVRDIQDLVATADDEPPCDIGDRDDESVPLSDGVAGATIAEQPDGEWHASLHTWIEGDSPFRKPFRPWVYALGGIFLVALAIFALVIVLGPH
jgi:hypothetical protein